MSIRFPTDQVVRTDADAPPKDSNSFLVSNSTDACGGHIWNGPSPHSQPVGRAYLSGHCDRCAVGKVRQTPVKPFGHRWGSGWGAAVSKRLPSRLELEGCGLQRD